MLIVSLIIAVLFLGFFIWSIKNGQYDDDFTPSVRILFDDEINDQKTNLTNDGDSEV